ncbi:MAG: Thif family protein [Cenarchaeum symbiont of Oopsacas minuta]|nr:Thif family protein [Cenarchaeum symbiont of Oopsacas minuta]
MPKITLTIPSVLNSGRGEKKLKLDVANLNDAFAHACKVMGEDFERRVMESPGKPRSLINVYINGKNSKFGDGLKSTLSDDDDVYILPAVAGGQEMSAKEMDRYSRQIMLEEIGYNGQIKLRNARVCVIGVGGLGHPIISRLTAMGIGTLRIIDRDVVELSNLHRQILFDESDVGKVKVEAAANKLKKMNSECKIEVFPVSINDHTAFEVTKGCDVVIDALDSVNARYSLNRACSKQKIPFVTGAAVGITGQVFTIMPDQSACYHCMFPALDEDSMPTCSIEGVHPPILSIVGAIQVTEAVKIILGKKPSLSDRILHIDLENLDFSFTRTFRQQECPVCGNGKEDLTVPKVMMIEEMCGRNRGKRTFSLTPPETFALDIPKVSQTATLRGFRVEKQGDMGLSLRTDDVSVSFMNRGSAVIVGAKDEDIAIKLYCDLLGRAQ